MTNKMRPIHPGEDLQEELDERGMTGNALAMELKVTPARINQILHGKRSVTADTALRLARYFGGSAEYWLALQAAYDIKMVSLEKGKQINRDIRPAAA